MTDRFHRIERLLDEYLELRETERAPSFEEWLVGHAEHADDLRAAWSDWCRAARAFEQDGDSGERDRRGLGPGTRVGPFVLVGPLGHGGQGSVWAAEQPELGRRVALKLLRPERVSERDLALFRREAQAGARLQHAGIVAVYDYDPGESGELAWIAQELVPGGRTLRHLVDEVRGSLAAPDDWYRTVARLVQQIASALAAAHSAGVIHRDVKPQNVLLTPEGQPKVSDFGLARIEGGSALSRSGELVGTYLYMSPEQVQARRTKIDHRTDVFSLGVVLYELLTLRRPFDGDTEPQICMRILTLDPPDPRTVRSQVPSDLAVICGKCLEKDPDRRYGTMHELVADLGRHLAHEPIHARPPGLWQRGAKWARRHPTRSVAAAVAAVAFATISALLEKNLRVNLELADQAIALEGARRDAVSNAEAATRNAAAARAGEARAEASARDANATIEFVQKALIDSDPNQGGAQDYRVVDAMDRAIQELDAPESGLEPLTRASLQYTIARILYGNARPEEALWLAEQSLMTRRQVVPGDDLETAEGLNTVGLCLQSLDRSEEALPKFEAALEMDQRLLEGDHLEVAASLNNLALCLESLGRPTDALAKAEAALAMCQRLSSGDDPDVAKYLNNVAACLRSLGRNDEALPMCEAALAMDQRLFPGDHPGVARDFSQVGTCLMLLGRNGEALPNHEAALAMCRRIFKGDHPEVAACLGNVAACLRSLGRSEEALPEFEAALEMFQRVSKDDLRHQAICLSNVAACLQSLHRSEEALPEYEAALEMLQRQGKGDLPAVAVTLGNIATCLQTLGRNEEAVPKYEAALEMRERLFEGDNRFVAFTLNDLAACLESLGRSEEALPLAERSAAMSERSLADGDPFRAVIGRTLVVIYESMDKSNPGQGYAERAIEYRAKLANSQK